MPEEMCCSLSLVLSLLLSPSPSRSFPPSLSLFLFPSGREYIRMLASSWYYGDCCKYSRAAIRHHGSRMKAPNSQLVCGGVAL